MKYEYAVAKSKIQRRVRLLLVFYFCLIAGDRLSDRKSIFKFSCLRWSLLFEDLYNGEGSSQANKTSKKTEFKLKTIRK